MDKVHFSSKRDDWETPPELFKELDEEFHFVLDVCATKKNAKCGAYYNRRDNGLKQNWMWSHGTSVFCNPPYGREIGRWVQKAYEESQKGVTVVCLLPARTDTRWFHEYCQKGEIRFIKGRIKFVGAKHSAPFPSMIVVFKKNKRKG